MLSNYIGARWYRSPEQLLGNTVYDFAIDMWALGCIMAEVYIGRPIFRGTCTYTQIEEIYRILGRPDNHDIQSMDAPYAPAIIFSYPIILFTTGLYE